jgi:hypothetical protein
MKSLRARVALSVCSGSTFLTLLIGGTGCYTPVDANNKTDRSAIVKRYAHCDTCNWCKGPYKRTQDVGSVVTEHNIRVHDYYKVAYYDMEKCK